MKRLLSIALAIVLVLSCIGTGVVTAFAYIENTGDFEFEEIWDANGEHVVAARVSGYTGQAQTVVVPSTAKFAGEEWNETLGEYVEVTRDVPVTEIGYSAFYSKQTIKTVRIPASVTTIGDFAFEDCIALNTLTSTASSATGVIDIPNTVTKLGEYAFEECKSIKKVVIPASITTLPGSVFEDCLALSEVDMSANTVSVMENYVFCGCLSLKSITLPSSLVTMGDAVFQNCTALSAVTIPQSVMAMGGDIFCGCTSLKSVTLAPCTAVLQNGVFGRCSNLESVSIPAELTLVEEDTFYDCSKLATVNYAGTIAEWKNVIIQDYNDSLQHAVIVCKNGIYHAMHAFGNAKVTKAATCSTAGEKLLTCTGVGCNATKTEVIPATGKHSVVADKAVAATYTKTGKTEGSHCSACGKVLTEQKTVAMKKLAQAKITSITNSSTGITVKWNKVAGATAYQVYRKVGTGSWKLIKTTTSTSMTNTSLTNGTKYQYKVRAIAKNSAGKIVNTGTYSAVKTMYRLTRPTLASGTKNIATKKIVVKWNKNTKATGYQIKYVKGSTAKTVKVKGAASLSKTLSKLTKGSTYKVSVRSYKTVSGTTYYSAYSAVKSVKVAK